MTLSAGNRARLILVGRRKRSSARGLHKCRSSQAANAPTGGAIVPDPRHCHTYREQEHDLGICLHQPDTRQSATGRPWDATDARFTTTVDPSCHWRWAKTEANGHYPASSKDDRIVGLPRGRTVLLSTAPARSSQVPRTMGERSEAHSTICADLVV
jgi:hypothetical protein